MKIILFFVRLILSTRYKVQITGEKNLSHNGPLLLLANHVALIDPRILISFLGKYINVSPVASEKYYNKPVIKQIMDMVGTVPIGEMTAGAKKEDVEKVFGQVVKELQNGKNILIYPSGQIYRQGFEVIRGKQSVYNIVKLMPDNTKVLGIRDRGLWGSLWSMAWDNGKTGFGMLYLKSIWYVIVNLIFFVPKRKVNIEIKDITNQIDAYKNMDLNSFNGFLENFYNRPIDNSSQPSFNTKGRSKRYEEKANYIKHYFYYNDVKNKKEPEIIEGSLKDLENTKSVDLSSISQETKNIVFEKIALIKEIPLSPALSPKGRKGEVVIDENKNLVIDLYFDSLDMAEIKSFIQAKFPGASNPPITDLKSVGDLLIMAEGKSDNEEELKDCNWQKWEEKGELVEKII